MAGRSQTPETPNASRSISEPMAPAASGGGRRSSNTPKRRGTVTEIISRLTASTASSRSKETRKRAMSPTQRSYGFNSPSLFSRLGSPASSPRPDISWPISAESEPEKPPPKIIGASDSTDRNGSSSTVYELHIPNKPQELKVPKTRRPHSPELPPIPSQAQQAEDARAQEAKEAKAQEAKEAKEAKAKEVKVARAHEAKEVQVHEVKEFKEVKEVKEVQKVQKAKKVQEVKEVKEVQKEPKETKERPTSAPKERPTSTSKEKPTQESTPKDLTTASNHLSKRSLSSPTPKRIPQAHTRDSLPNSSTLAQPKFRAVSTGRTSTLSKSFTVGGRVTPSGRRTAFIGNNQAIELKKKIGELEGILQRNRIDQEDLSRKNSRIRRLEDKLAVLGVSMDPEAEPERISIEETPDSTPEQSAVSLITKTNGTLEFDMSKEKVRLEARVAVLESENAVLTQDKERLEGILATRQTEVESSDATSQSLRKQLTRLEANLKVSQSQVQVEKRKADYLLGEFDCLKAARETLLRQVAGYESAQEALEKDARMAQRETRRRQKIIIGLETAINDLKLSLEEKALENDELLRSLSYLTQHTDAVIDNAKHRKTDSGA